jgi:glyoxalase family protein
MGLELRAASTPDAALIAEHPEIPAELALQGFDGVKAFATDPERSRQLFEGILGFVPAGNETWEVRGESRGGLFAFDPPPAERGSGGAGTVHHVAFATQMAEQEAWQQTVARAGMHPTPVIDRFWFRSIYFREPNGVLFELATLGPGFSVDEDPAHLGETLILPPAFEHLRERIEPVLTPIVNPRTSWAKTS